MQFPLTNSSLAYMLGVCCMIFTACNSNDLSDDSDVERDAGVEDVAPADTSDARDTGHPDINYNEDTADVASDSDDADQDGIQVITPSWKEDVVPLLRNYGCGGLYCHTGGEGGFTWGSRQETYDDLVGVVSEDDYGCSTLERVNPGNPETSLLFRKLEETQPCGAPMPPNGPKLTEIELGVLRRWIAAGAPNN